MCEQLKQLKRLTIIRGLVLYFLLFIIFYKINMIIRDAITYTKNGTLRKARAASASTAAQLLSLYIISH